MSAAIVCPAVCVSYIINKAGMYGKSINYISDMNKAGMYGKSINYISDIMNKAGLCGRNINYISDIMNKAGMSGTNIKYVMSQLFVLFVGQKANQYGYARRSSDSKHEST